MSWNSGSGLDLGSGLDAAIARPVLAARLRRWAQESSGYLDEGEKLTAPVANCSRGGRGLVFTGMGIFAAAWVVGMVVAFVHQSLAGAVIFGGSGAGLLVILSALFVTHNHALALTDRRLIVFRRGGASGRRHIQDVFIAVPRSEVSTDFKTRLGWGILSLEFAPATGQAPIQLDCGIGPSPDKQIVWAIHQALATAAPSAPGSTRLPAG